jgi:Mrp family chromosome partitioning ATPase
LLIVADAMLLSTMVDGVVMMTESGRTRAGDMRKATEELRRVRANLLGIVLNRVPMSQGNYNYYYYKSNSEGESRRQQRKKWLPRWLPWRFHRARTE